jgi:hypothetical protein
MQVKASKKMDSNEQNDFNFNFFEKIRSKTLMFNERWTL